MDTTPVGFIGIGVMGGPMATNVLRAGFPLHVYDRNLERVKELQGKGAVPHESAAEIAAAVPITVTCLPADENVEEAVLGSKGWLAGASSENVLIEATTGTPQVMSRVAEACKAKQVDLLDAPISGGARGAKEGTLTFIVGGEASVLKRCRPVLDTMGKTVFHVGPVGAGKAMKLLNQIMLAMNTWGACEAAVLAKKAGVDLELMLDVVSKSSGQSFTMDYRLPQFIMKGDFAPGFRTALQIKDLDLALKMANSLDVPMLLTGAVFQAFRASAGAGNGDLDTSAAARWLGEMAGVSFP
jgi:3-hydroxyisobutyrate dehydrogenase-like beta-hydroxyacid dehydrogenase